MWYTALPVLIAALFGDANPSLTQDIVVIVNGARTAELGAEEIAQIYLKKRRFWGDGTPILPVNRNADADTRSAFDRAIFGDLQRRLPVYWNRAYFQGVLPPLTLASDEAVRRFVATEPRAIGYVRADAVDDSVRVVLTLEAPTHREP